MSKVLIENINGQYLKHYFYVYWTLFLWTILIVKIDPFHLPTSIKCLFLAFILIVFNFYF